MATYIILSKISPEAVQDPSEFHQLAQQVASRLKEQCPEIEWKHSYATLGRFDVIDIVEAPSQAVVERAAMIIRCHGHATTETLPATTWRYFVDSLKV